MSGPIAAPYGSWKSPITSKLIASGTIGLTQIELDGEDVYWVEMRPTEGGRYVIVRRTPDGRTADVTPAPFNARTRVHEYGGGGYLVADGTIYFSNFPTQRRFRRGGGGGRAPALRPDGARLAWLTWNHPNMPWDGTELWVAPLGADGALGRAVRVAGGA